MAEIASAYVSLLPSASKLVPGAIAEGSKAGDAGGKSFSEKFTSIAKKSLLVGGIVGGAGVAVAKGLFNIGATFDDVSDTIRVGTGATGKNLDALVDVAKNVGKNVPVEFSKIGPVVADLNTRLGLSGKTLDTVAQQYLQAGKIMGEDIDIKSTTAAFSAFGITGDKVSDAMDHLFQISQATGVGMNALSATVGAQAPALKNLGFTFEDTASLVGSLDKAGVDSTATLASMSKGLVTLAKAGKDPQKAFKDVTTEVEALVKQGKTAEAIKLASGIFGTRGAAQFVGAVQSGKLAVGDLMKATGATSDTIMGAAKDTADFGEAWQTFKNKAQVALEPIGAKVFNGISNAMKTVSDGFEPMIAKATAVGATVSAKLGPAFAGAKGAISAGLTTAMATVGPTLSSVGGIFMDTFKSIFDKLAPVFQQILPLVMQLVTAFSPVKVLFDAILPILPQIAAVFGQIASVIADTLVTAFNALKPALDVFVGLIQQLIPFITQLITSLLPPLSSLFAAVGPALQTILAALTPVIDTISAVLIPILNALMPVVQTVFGFITGAIKAAMTVIQGIIQVVTGMISGNWSKVWDGIKLIITGVWDYIKLYITTALKLVTQVLDAAWAVIKGAMQVAWSLIKAAILVPAQAIWDGIKIGFNAIVGVLSGVWKTITGAVTTAWNAVKTAITTAINAVKTVISTVTGAIGTAWSSFWNGLTKVASGVFDTIKGLAGGIWDGITGGLKGALNGAISLLNSAINFINSKLIDTANLIPFVNIPHIPSIPKLAQGGMVTGPQIAMVGDNPSGHEAVLPMDSPRTVQLFADALKSAGSSQNSAETNGLLRQVLAAIERQPVRAQQLALAGGR